MALFAPAFTRRVFAAGLLDFLAPAPAPVAAPTRTVLPAIEAHRSANLLLDQAVADHVRAERADDPAQVMLLRFADAASDAEADALRTCVPADAAEMRVLISYYAELAAGMDPRMFGSWLLSGLAALPPVSAAPTRKRFGLSRLLLITGEAATVAVMIGGGAALSGFVRLF